MEGVIKKWLDRGYGCIGVADKDERVFVHSNDIEDVFELRKGQKVEFDLENSPKGPRAVNVKIVE